MSWIELEPVLRQIGIFAILAMSLNVIVGLTGLLHIGQAGFYAVGAYTAGLIAIYATVPALGWANFLIGAAGGIVLCMFFSLILGLACLRLQGDYLAIATLGFGEIVRQLLMNLTFPGGAMYPDEFFGIGGSMGIAFTEMPEMLWPAYPEYQADYATLPVIWGLVVLTYLLLRNVKFSRSGRAMMCIREDEIAARAMGIHVPRYKLTAFLISAAFAGLAGALFFHSPAQRAAPGSFELMTSIEILLIVVLGGMGSLSGSLLAAVLLGFLPQLLTHVDLSDVQWLPEMLQIQFGQHRQLVYALLLMVMIRVAPNGLLGRNELPGWLGCRRTGGEPA